MNKSCCQTSQSARPANSESACCNTERKVATYLPSVDVVESNDAIRIRADVPGASPQSVEMTFEDDTLTFRAAIQPRENSGRVAVHREYGHGDYIRSFTINQPVDRDRIQASLAGGVLTVTLPKPEAVQPRRIAVTPGNN